MTTGGAQGLIECQLWGPEHEKFETPGLVNPADEQKENIWLHSISDPDLTHSCLSIWSKIRFPVVSPCPETHSSVPLKG